MFPQQSFPKMTNNVCSGKLSLKNRWSQIIVVVAWIFCLVSAEVSLVSAAPCTGNKAENCTSDCNVSCIATWCSNGTGECKNNTTEDQVTKTDIPLPSDTEENEPLVPLLKCDYETEDCKNNTTEAVVSNTAVENASAAEIIGCEGHYGANCSIACPVNCVGARCDNVTGDCSTGCRIGYQGPRCTETCATGYHGNECEKSCPTNCASNECHHEHGYCLTGCKEDYWGSDCSLVGEFKDNPEPAQDHFYQHLSAESKSVLLYMLMSKYEETLERAQLEVNRGRQLRNKLRAIMGG